ncbi:MAG: hypothetical protein HXS54_06020 [Theionarchaea archaeon]|nr:hypothetical protein [Theionarchaea archaeon]DBA34818.1 TPA_asm: hypothetical protein vir521_00024 [Caudoviricetes sp. vir521]
MKVDKEVKPPVDELGGIKEGHFSVPRQMIDETWQPEMEPEDVNKMRKELIRELETWREEIQKEFKGAVDEKKIMEIITRNKRVGEEKYGKFFSRKEINDAFLDYVIELYDLLYTYFWEG